MVAGVRKNYFHSLIFINAFSLLVHTIEKVRGHSKLFDILPIPIFSVVHTTEQCINIHIHNISVFPKNFQMENINTRKA